MIVARQLSSNWRVPFWGRMKFIKPALSFEAQAQLLASRGLLISDLVSATAFLTHVNYYRLAGYVLPFEIDHASHQIRPGTHFEQVAQLYLFDRELRSLVLDAIEKLKFLCVLSGPITSPMRWMPMPISMGSTLARKGKWRVN
jgi:hypothetical protein